MHRKMTLLLQSRKVLIVNYIDRLSVCMYPLSLPLSPFLHIIITRLPAYDDQIIIPIINPLTVFFFFFGNIVFEKKKFGW